MPFIRPRPLIVLATLLFVALTVRLGIWQLDRGHQKDALAQQQAAADSKPLAVWHGEFGESAWQQKFLVHGVWFGAGQILLDNRVHNEVAGYDVMAPLVLEDGRLMPVLRGWLPRTSIGVPTVPVPQGEVTLAIRLTPPAQHYVELSADTVAGAVWQNIDWQRYQALVKKPLVPALAYQLDGTDALVRDWPRQGVGAERHYMYAGQWFLFAGLALALFIILHWKRSPR